MKIGFLVGLQARNFLRQMKAGQQAFFYHSNCKEPGIAGIMTVSFSSLLVDIKTWAGFSCVSPIRS